MKKVFSTLIAATVMTALFTTSAYAMCGRGYSRGYAQASYSAQGSANLNYAGVNAYPSLDVDSLVAAREAYLNDLVTQGIITQEYADATLNNYRIMLEYCAINGGYGGFGGCYGGGFCGGGGFGGYYNR